MGPTKPQIPANGQSDLNQLPKADPTKWVQTYVRADKLTCRMVRPPWMLATSRPEFYFAAFDGLSEQSVHRTPLLGLVADLA